MIMDWLIDFDGNAFVVDPVTGEKTAVDDPDKDNTLDMISRPLLCTTKVSVSHKHLLVFSSSSD